jgi:hypothetical protein
LAIVPLGTARILHDVNLIGTTSLADVVQRVRDYQAHVKPGQWIHGRGWDQNDWTKTLFPTWRDLDATEANPVYLDRVDGHAVWVNHRALEVCGITRDTADPRGGRILRDENGEPTGVFIDEATTLGLNRKDAQDRVLNAGLGVQRAGSGGGGAPCRTDVLRSRRRLRRPSVIGRHAWLGRVRRAPSARRRRSAPGRRG